MRLPEAIIGRRLLETTKLDISTDMKQRNFLRSSTVIGSHEVMRTCLICR